MAAHLYCFYFGILADDTPPVGLAAYAGAAIANASPIAVGIQGFFYDIRTALLPLAFIFNHDIILWNIHSMPEAILIFCMTALGMICFSSVMQGWFIDRTNLLDRALLLAATVTLMYPALLTGFFLPYEHRHVGYAAGIGFIILAYLRQKAGRKFSAHKEISA
jgi:TRAP-type uncharacterized transport system fused permease subunit